MERNCKYPIYNEKSFFIETFACREENNGYYPIYNEKSFFIENFAYREESKGYTQQIEISCDYVENVVEFGNYHVFSKKSFYVG